MKAHPSKHPHVTAILARAGLMGNGTSFFRDFDLERGSAVHQACEYLDHNDLDWSTVDPIILGRVRSYQIFKDEVRPRIFSIEEQVVNETYQYCGTLDRRVEINGRQGVLDLKGPSRAPWQAIQLAMYANCFDLPLARWTLHLGDTEYRLIEHVGRNDWNVARAAITIAAWRTANE